MNLGLGNLNELKAQLLAEALRSDTSYDAIITAIGKGVAAQFEKYCGRKFERTEGAVDTHPADRCQFLLSRFPVESVTLSEIKDNETDGWVAQETGFIRSLDLISGIVFLADTRDAGGYWASIRFTYTGGYWFDDSEDASGQLPSGATQLPDDLKLAWFNQCRAVWTAIDKIGVDIARTGNPTTAENTVASLALVPSVKDIVNLYRRMEMI